MSAFFNFIGSFVVCRLLWPRDWLVSDWQDARLQSAVRKSIDASCSVNMARSKTGGMGAWLPLTSRPTSGWTPLAAVRPHCWVFLISDRGGRCALGDLVWMAAERQHGTEGGRGPGLCRRVHTQDSRQKGSVLCVAYSRHFSSYQSSYSTSNESRLRCTIGL